MPTDTDLEISHAPGQPIATEVEGRLIEELQRASAQLDQLEPEVAKMLSNDDAIQEDRDAARTALERARKNVDTAHQALDRFRTGSYGLCSKCSLPIGAERLAAIPDTDLCVSCRANC
ncbi:MAG: TraR/DksA C4-type zinc finger protein [Ilumatobacteraceae bacterium]